MWASNLEPDENILDIPMALRQQAWQASPNSVQPWIHYLNQLALDTVTAFLEADAGLDILSLSLEVDARASQSWAFLNGSGVQLNHDGETRRLILMPMDAVDAAGSYHLSVPQEWVDLPSWVGDYYLGVQLNPQEDELQLLGYCTHQQLKTQGEFDDLEQAYELPIADLLPWDSFLAGFAQLAPEQLRAPVPAIASITPASAQSMFQQLAQPTVHLPRQALPFDQWGALLEAEEWRSQLYQTLVKKAQAASSPGAESINRVTQLSAWLQGNIDNLWQGLDELLAPAQLAIARQSSASSDSIPESSYQWRGKVLQFPTAPPTDNRFVFLVGIAPQDNTDSFQISIKLDPSALSAPNSAAAVLSMELQNDTGDLLSQASAQPGEMIRMAFGAERGDRFTVSMSLDSTTLEERFEV